MCSFTRSLTSALDRDECGQLYAHGKSPWYLLDKKLGGLQSRFGRDGEEKKFPAPAGNQTL
jgi:hypothetical protein